jgi:hypothetical protein
MRINCAHTCIVYIWAGYYWCGRAWRRSGFVYKPFTDTGKLGAPSYHGTRVPVRARTSVPSDCRGNQRLARYRSTRYAATRQLRSSGTQQTRRVGFNITRISASPHVADLHSYRRSARFKHG